MQMTIPRMTNIEFVFFIPLPPRGPMTENNVMIVPRSRLLYAALFYLCTAYLESPRNKSSPLILEDWFPAFAGMTAFAGISPFPARRPFHITYSTGMTSMDTSGAVIMPPIRGAAMRRMTSEPVPPPSMIRQQCRDDDRNRHGLGAHAQYGAFDHCRVQLGGLSWDEGVAPPGRDKTSITTPNSAATPARAMKPTPAATER